MNILNIHILGVVFSVFYNYLELLILINYIKIIHKADLHKKNIQLGIDLCRSNFTATVYIHFPLTRVSVPCSQEGLSPSRSKIF
jgi:hypothetical protein